MSRCPHNQRGGRLPRCYDAPKDALWSILGLARQERAAGRKMWIWIGAFPGEAHGRNVLPPLRGRYRAGLALRHQSPVDRRRRRTNQHQFRQPLDVWLRIPHLCRTPIGGASAASTWMRPRPHPTREVHEWIVVRVRVQGEAGLGLRRNLEVGYLAFVTSYERHPMIRLSGVR